MLKDSDGDGRADVQRVVVRRPMLHGQPETLELYGMDHGIDWHAAREIIGTFRRP